MKEIVSLLVGKLADLLPTFALRLFFPPSKIAKEVRVDLRGEKPVQARTDAAFPDISVWLELTNLSHVDLTLDRLLFDLWFGQPTITGSILEFEHVPARSGPKTIRFWTNLTPSQVSRIDDFMHSGEARGPLSLSYSAYFQSRVGMVTAKGRIERQGV